VLTDGEARVGGGRGTMSGDAGSGRQAHVGSIGWVQGGLKRSSMGAGLCRGAPGVQRSVGPRVRVMDPLICHPR
jgi:hypothetical protein